MLGSLVSVRSLSLLGTLKPSYKSTFTEKRVGRGASSGYGKTSGRGQKGQKARGKVKSWFEGGQTPIFKLFPKSGFKNTSALRLNELNLFRIVEFIKDGRLQLKEGEVLDMRMMKKSGLITGNFRDGVKILANGKERLDFPIKIEATRASAEAIRAIEKAGGEFTARFFTRLGLRVHLHPKHFFSKTGYIPIQARPTSQKFIDYYSNPLKRGYLIKEDHPLLKAISDAKTAPPPKRVLKKTMLEGLLNQASTVNKSELGFNRSGVVKFSDLKL